MTNGRKVYLFRVIAYGGLCHEHLDCRQNDELARACFEREEGERALAELREVEPKFASQALMEKYRLMLW